MTTDVTLVWSRDDGLPRQEFVERFEAEHAPLVGDLPGLVRFTTAVPIDPGEIGHGLGPDGAGYDVVVQLRFDSAEDLRVAFDSPEGRRVVADARTFADFDESVVIAVGDDTLQYRSLPTGL